MAQHDYDIANGTGAAVRADINAALTAVLTTNSGGSAPTTTQAYMLWADTTSGLLKLRNAANNGWVTVGTMATPNLGLALVTGGTTFHAAGSAALPSYSFSGDANTGFYAPAADTVALSLAGTERSRWEPNGYFKASAVGFYYEQNSHQLSANNASLASIYLTNNNGSFTGNLVQIYANRNTTNGTFKVIDYFNLVGGNVRFSVNDAGLLLAKGSYDTTSASAANVFIESDGTMKRSTSSVRYKTDIEPIKPEVADAVLTLNPVRYRSLADGDNTSWSWYGLIAEDVATVEPRLVHWGYRDEDYEIITTEEQKYNEETNEVETREVNKSQLKEGAVKRPEGVQYDRLPVLLLEIIKRHEVSIAALEAKIAALEV